MSTVDRTSVKNQQQNLWEEFLSEAKLNSSFQDSHVLLLGPRSTGKRSLINAVFQNITGDTKNNTKIGTKGQTSALEYTYILVKNPEDPENDEYVSKMNVWILDEPKMSGLLAHCLREDTIERMIICICLDMSEAWKAMSTLSEWMDIISDRLQKILRDMPLHKQDKLRAKLAKYITTYEQPQFDEEKKLIVPKTKTENGDEDQVDAPLPEGVLKINFGVPLMILGTKADELELIEKEKDGDYKLDFLQHSLRSFALPYASTLLYLSLKQNINLDIFYDYLIHRLYGFGLKYNAEVIHKDSIFIPAGYDKPRVINETLPNVKQGDIFEEVISQPARKKALNKEEVVTQDTQAFLKELKVKMSDSKSEGPPPEEFKAESSPTPTNSSTSKAGQFFNNLRPTASIDPKGNGDSTPSHMRTTSHQTSGQVILNATADSSTGSISQVPSTGSISQAPSTGSISQAAPARSTKQSRAERLMELLKK